MQTNDFSNLPTSWQIKTLGEVCEITMGQSPLGEKVINKKQNTNSKALEFHQGKICFTDKFITESEVVTTDIRKVAQSNSILLCVRAPVGVINITQRQIAIGRGLCALNFKDKNSNNDFLYFYLLTLKNYFNEKATGSTFSAINLDTIKNTKIPLPSLEIQKRIVARLESAFEKIEKGSAHLQDAKTKLAKYKQSLLKSAFDGTLTAAASLRESAADEAIHKVDCHDLTSSNLAMTDKENPKLPQGWTIKTLGEIAQTTSGGTPSRKKLDYWNGNIKWLKSGELNDNYINEVEETITQSGLENSSAKIFSKGTLLIALYGATIGKLGILNLETSTNQAVCAIMPNKELETKYLFHFLFSIRNKMIKDAFGGAQSNISQTYLKQIKIPLPPLEIQKQIVKLLEKHLQHTDKTGEFIESALNKAKQLKQSLLKSAFLGELT